METKFTYIKTVSLILLLLVSMGKQLVDTDNKMIIMMFWMFIFIGSLMTLLSCTVIEYFPNTALCFIGIFLNSVLSILVMINITTTVDEMEISNPNESYDIIKTIVWGFSAPYIILFGYYVCYKTQD